MLVLGGRMLEIAPELRVWVQVILPSPHSIWWQLGLSRDESPSLYKWRTSRKLHEGIGMSRVDLALLFVQV